MRKAPSNIGYRLGNLREDIQRTEGRIEESMREIGGRLSVESLSTALAAKGGELFAQKLRPSISGLGDTMKETLNKVLEAVNRDPCRYS
jgi:hypothetical protein